MSYKFGYFKIGAEAFISLPHFYNAEQKFVDAFTGLSPNQELHDFVLSFEPVRFLPIICSQYKFINI